MKSLFHFTTFLVSILISTFSIGQTVIINETFSGSSLPSGWSNSDNAGTGNKWTFNDPGNRNISAGNFSGNYAIVDSDNYGSSSSQRTKLSTPTFDVSTYESVTLEFDHQYRDYDGPEYCRVQVYNGSSWTTVQEYLIGDENYNGADHITVDITTETGGSANARVRFFYKGEYDWWWAIDNVKITGTEPSLVANPTGPGGIGTGDGSSGLVLWLDANTVSASNGSTVTTWPDNSGNGYNFTNGNGATYVSSAQNGYPAFSFNGTSKYFERNFTSGLTPDDFTIFSTNQATSSSAYKCIISNRDDPSGTATKGFILYSIPTSNHWQFWTGNTSSSWNTGPQVNSTAGSWAGVMFEYNGSTNNKLINSNASADATGTSVMTKNSTRPIRVGAGRNETTPNYYFKGYMGEIIMFNQLLTDVEKIIIKNYLSGKYNYSLSSEDYYTQDNSGAGNFDHHIAGIGRAADGSIHNNSQGTGIIKINTPSNLGTNEFLFWGENTKNATYEFSTNSTDYMDRLNSTWRVSMHNDVGTVSLSVAAADLNLSNKQSCSALRLVVSSSSNFSSKTSYDLSLADGVYTAVNVDFDDDDYFTFEYKDVIAVDNSSFYNGSGSSSSPSNSDVCYKLLVKSSADGSFNLGQDATVREVEIEAGGIFTINSGFTLISDGDIINNGTVTVEENSSIIQNTTGSNNNSGSGNYIVSRTGNTNPYVYNIWSSPITSANVVSVFNNSNPCDIWVFDRTSQAWSYDFPIGFSTTCNGNNVTFAASDVIAGGDGIMDVCGGYFIPGNTASTKTYDGTINNGDYLKPISTTSLGNPGGTDWGDDDWNLLGNPYPSGLSAAAFWTENAINNSRITDALYFWDEADTTNGYNQNSDYASWNLLGGVNSGNSSKIPNGNIASGQGFWVVANSNSNVVFNNSMRSSSNSQYFKTDQPIDNHVAWIGVTSPSGHKNNVLVGYNDLTTDGIDTDFDAHKLLGNSHIRLATLIDGEEFSIQGFEKLGIGHSKVIPLILFAGETGNHVFNEYKRENLPASTKVYIRDLLMGTTQDLAQSGYTVALTGNQTYSNRFELVFEKTISSNNDHSWVKNSPSNVTSVTDVNEASNYILQKSENGYTLSNADGIKGDMKVMDVTGKVVWSKTNVNATHVNINFENVSSGFYFVQIIQGKERIYQHKLMNP